MATKDINKVRLQALKKKSFAQKRASYNLESALNNITRSLFPQRQEQPQQEEAKAPVDYTKKINELESKLAANQNNNSIQANARDEEMQKSLSQLRKALSGQLQSLGESTLENDKALQKAIDDRPSQTTEGEEDKPETQEAITQPEEKDPYGQHNNYGRALEKAVPPTAPVEKKAAAPMKKVLAEIGQYVDVGNFKYKVSNLFALREGKNAVAGRKGHSNGIDVVGTDAQGRSTNMPIAIADGKIVNISVQGTGEAYKPTAIGADGKQRPASGGYIMDVKIANGKIMRYMHLGKDVMLDKDKLVGKQVRRGDPLHNRDNSTGSGSQTKPHTKISITSVGKDGKYLLDYSNPENDPTPYLFGEG